MVKLWKGVWTFMKRTSRDVDDDGCCYPSKSGDGTSKKTQATMTMMELDGGTSRRSRMKGRRGLVRGRNGKERRAVADTVSLLDSTDTTLGDESASWRVENILATGSPQATDWWEEDLLSTFSSSSSSSSSSSPLEPDCEGSTPPPGADAEPPNGASSPSRRLRFRNVGYLTWQQVQHNWRSSGVSQQESDAVLLARVPSPSSRRELAKVLAKNREYEMKHRVGLAHLVAIYNEMWTEEWSE